MLQVRNVPDDVHSALRKRAAKSGMSLSEFVLHELERLASRPSVDEVAERAAQRGGRMSFADALDALHEGRAERQ